MKHARCVQREMMECLRFGLGSVMEQKECGNSFYKVWEVLKPFLLYYVICNLTFLIIIFLYDAAAEYLSGGMREYLAEHVMTVTQLVNAISMVVAVLPLVPMLRRELESRKPSESRGLLLKTAHDTRQSGRIGHMALSVLSVVILAASSSVGLNILLSLTELVKASETYQAVERQQYSVVFGVGAVLFGLISPIAEEIVFRGLIFNRMRRYYPTFAAIVISGALFGVYHGNLVQGVYGGCMGILLAYTYEKMHSFFIPCLFHAVANITVYTLAQNAELHTRLFTVPGCVILLAISVICIFSVIVKCKDSYL